MVFLCLLTSTTFPIIVSAQPTAEPSDSKPSLVIDPTVKYVSIQTPVTLKVTVLAANSAVPNITATPSLPKNLAWDTNDHNIAEVQDGVVTGHNPGPIIVTVTDPAGEMNQERYPLLVTPGEPVSIAVSADANVIPSGGKTTLSVTAIYKDAQGNLQPPVPINEYLTFALPPGDAKKVKIQGNVLTGLKSDSTAAITVTELYFPPGADTSKPFMIRVAAESLQSPQFAELPKGGNSYIYVFAHKDEKLAVYQFDADYGPDKAAGKTCGMDVGTGGTLIPMVTTGATTTESAHAFDISGQAILTLSRPIVAGTQLCLVNTAATPMLDDLMAVNDPNDFGRARTYMNLGFQISNQLPAAASGTPSGTAQSSTAGEYLEIGLGYSLLRAAPFAHGRVIPGPRMQVAGGRNSKHYETSCQHFLCGYPGVHTNIDFRLSPVPVSATVTAPASSGTGSGSGTASGGSTTNPPTISSLNLLSSQQSLRVVGQVFFPVPLMSWQRGYNVKTFSPYAKAGFTTLLNPTSNGVASSGLPTSANFSPTYSFFGYGGRLAWDRYPRDTDKSPQMVTQLIVAFMKYSSLPSYLCTSDPTKLGETATVTTDLNGNKTTTNAFSFTTACGQGDNKDLKYITRTLEYRMDIEGLAKLPGYPFVIGVNANLAQYGLSHIPHLDYLNKPGNDIRIFLGLSIPLNSLGSLFTTGTIGK